MFNFTLGKFSVGVIFKAHLKFGAILSLVYTKQVNHSDTAVTCSASIDELHGCQTIRMRICFGLNANQTNRSAITMS